MNKKEKADFDAYVVEFTKSVLGAYKAKGYDNAEDMSQEFAMLLSAERVKISGAWYAEAPYAAARIAKQVELDERSRSRGMKLMDLEKAVSVPEVSTPYHFLIAQEIAYTAECLDIDCVMMGDTLEDEADHYGVTRQRAHQIISERRDQMAEYLTP